MSLLVVGSVAFDSVKTPFGEVDEVLGGSATYFSTAASYFSDVSLVAVVGDDFPDKHLKFLKSRNIDIEGIEKREGKTFRWKGEYGYELNEAQTLDTQLGCPKIEQQPDLVPRSLEIGQCLHNIHRLQLTLGLDLDHHLVNDKIHSFPPHLFALVLHIDPYLATEFEIKLITEDRWNFAAVCGIVRGRFAAIRC